MSPYLSIIVPVYNCREYLAEGLDSILSQLPPDAELIVVDDGSTDGTAELLPSYEGRQENLRILYRGHRGVSPTRNAGLEAARGEYVAFMDCDDTMKSGFLTQSRPLLRRKADLYIFSIERVTMNGQSEFWSVQDRDYADASDYADAYVRTGHLLIYSNCNKFYRRSILEAYDLRFDEETVFGEDRLFNYRFLMHCGAIISSSLTMFRYLQRSVDSLSERHVPDFFRLAMQLHEAKMQCFLSLSGNTSRKERTEFIAYDLSKEIENLIERFDKHPSEQEENLPQINKMVFGGPWDSDTPVDLLIVMGSMDCEYRVRRALEIGRNNPQICYIVSGGNPHLTGKMTEAEFMAAYLREQGVPERDIYAENRARYSKQNLELSSRILQRICKERKSVRSVGIVTGGFHVPRVKYLVEELNAFQGLELHYFPAYGKNVRPDNWYRNTVGRELVLHELRKMVRQRNQSNEEE